MTQRGIFSSSSKKCRPSLPLLSFAALVVFMKLLITRYSSESYSDYLLRSLEGPLKYDDPELIRYIRDKILESPSKLPYQLEAGSHKRIHDSEKLYEHYNEMLFHSKRNGFFVEAGALDGQAMSNTIDLEVKQGWTGLLVEPDPSNYKSLRKKHRKAWTAKACLSIEEYPKKERFTSFNIRNVPRKSHAKGRAMGTMVHELDNHTIIYQGYMENELSNSFYTRQCFPLASLLLAVNVTRVDLLSLDVEFVEKAIIEHFDFHRFDVQVVYMEWWDFKTLMWLNEFMQGKGFYFVRNTPGDIIYVKENSEAQRIVDEKHLRGNFNILKLVNDLSTEPK